MNDEVHFGMPGSCEVYNDEGDELDESDAIPPPAGDNRPQLNSSGLTCEPVILTGMRATKAMMRTQIRRKKHRKPMMD